MHCAGNGPSSTGDSLAPPPIRPGSHGHSSVADTQKRLKTRQIDGIWPTRLFTHSGRGQGVVDQLRGGGRRELVQSAALQWKTCFSVSIARNEKSFEAETVCGHQRGIGIAEIMGKANDTPMMRQYLQIKAQVPDAFSLSHGRFLRTLLRRCRRGRRHSRTDLDQSQSKALIHS